MKKILEKLKKDYLFGCVKYKGDYHIYLMPIAWWILNYQKYDPTYDPNKWNFVFRDNILNVENDKIDDFIHSIKDDRLDTNELRFSSGMQKRNMHLFFFIDFDSKLFVNGFPDIEVEEYLPNENWGGKFGEPLNYLPEGLKSFFNRSST